MCRIPVAAVLVAGVQLIGVNRVSATGSILPGVRCKARRFQAKLLTEPRLVPGPHKLELLPGQTHGASENTWGQRACRRQVREHVSLGGSAARASTRIGVCICSYASSGSCSIIGARSVVRHLVRHDALQDGRIGDPRALLGPDGGDGLLLPQRVLTPFMCTLHLLAP